MSPFIDPDLDDSDHAASFVIVLIVVACVYAYVQFIQ